MTLTTRHDHVFVYIICLKVGQIYEIINNFIITWTRHNVLIGIACTRSSPFRHFVTTHYFQFVIIQHVLLLLKILLFIFLVIINIMKRLNVFMYRFLFI